MKNIFQAARYTSYALLGVTLISAILTGLMYVVDDGTFLISWIWRIINLLFCFITLLFWCNFCWQCDKKAPILPSAAILCGAFIFDIIIQLLNYTGTIYSHDLIMQIMWALSGICAIIGISMLGRFFPNKTPIKKVVRIILILIILEFVMPIINSVILIVYDYSGVFVILNSITELLPLLIYGFWARFYHLLYLSSKQ